MPALQIIIVLLCAVTFALSAAYFWKIKQIYRWNQFAAALIMLIVGVIYIIDGEILFRYYDLLVFLLCVLVLSWIFTAWVKYYNEKSMREVEKYKMLQEIKRDLGIGQ